MASFIWLHRFVLSMVFRLKTAKDDSTVFIRKATTVAQVIKIGMVICCLFFHFLFLKAKLLNV